MCFNSQMKVTLYLNKFALVLISLSISILKSCPNVETVLYIKQFNTQQKNTVRYKNYPTLDWTKWLMCNTIKYEVNEQNSNSCRGICN